MEKYNANIHNEDYTQKSNESYLKPHVEEHHENISFERLEAITILETDDV